MPRAVSQPADSIGPGHATPCYVRVAGRGGRWQRAVTPWRHASVGVPGAVESVPCSSTGRYRFGVFGGSELTVYE